MSEGLTPTLGMLIVSACTLVFSFIVVGAERAEANIDVDSPSEFFDLIKDVATMNIDNAPWWIRVPISIVNIVPWVVQILILLAAFIPG